MLACGAVAIQRRRDSLYPALNLNSHPGKGWQNTYFYCKDTSPAGEPPLPSFRSELLEITPKMNSFADEESRDKLDPLYTKIRALRSHGILATDLVKCWVGWRIQPLSIRSRLMCTYTNKPSDDLRFTKNTLNSEAIIKAAKKFLSLKAEEVKKVGIAPFHAGNPPPTVSSPFTLSLSCRTISGL